MKTALTAALALVLAGCAHSSASVADESAPQARARDYYPLAVGNHWTYQAKMLGEGRSLDVAILKETNGYFEDNQGAKLTVDADGVRDERRYLLKNPIRTGASWDNVVSVSAREHYRIAEADAPCQVPAGRFEHCVTVESRNRTREVTLVNRLTFARNVGLVRLQVTAETGGKEIPQTGYALTSYVVEQPGAKATSMSPAR